VTGAFDLQVRIALYSGIILSSPVWLGEIFGFLTPGLTARERKYTFGFLAVAIPLYLAGCLTGLYVFPRMVEVLTSFASSEDSTILQASYYFDFVFKIVLATGIAFVLPVILVMLNSMGLLSARTITKAWRVSIVGIVVFAALVTPAADVLSMVFVAAPMILLFLAALAGVACSAPCILVFVRARGLGRTVSTTEGGRCRIGVFVVLAPRPPPALGVLPLVFVAAAMILLSPAPLAAARKSTHLISIYVS